MSTPVLWILFPLAFSLVLIAFQHYPRVGLGMGGLVLLTLALSAWKLPIDHTITFGPVSVRLTDTLDIAGRSFTLGEESRPILILLFVTAAFWYFGALAAKVNPLFAAVGFAMLGFFIAALSVQPFLYSALLIEMAVLASIPLLSPPHEPVQSGVTRYLIFQTTAMPFILFTGWMLTGVEAGNADINLPLRAGLLLGLGFALLLAVFPFHSWIPLIAEQNHPYAAGFVFLLLQTAVLLFGVELLDQFAWLRGSGQLYDVLRLTGVLMIVAGGILAAFQNHMGRILGFAVVFETGFSLIALSLGGQTGLELFSLLFLPRMVAFAVWALSLSAIYQVCHSLRLDHLAGVGRRYPVPFAGAVLASLSLVGLPLLAGFPVKLSLLETLAVSYPIVAIWTLAGMIGLVAAIARSLSVFASGERWVRDKGTPWQADVLLVCGIVCLFLMGTMPQVFLAPMLAMLKSLPHLL